MATPPKSQIPSGLATPSQTTTKIVTYTNPTFRLPEPYVDLGFHSKVKFRQDTGVVRTMVMPVEDLSTKASLLFPEPELLRKEWTPLVSSIILQIFKVLDSAAYVAFSQRMTQPIIKHSYLKFKGRSEDNDDADFYIKLFGSVSATNRKEADADRVRIFHTLLRKKARSVRKRGYATR